MSLAVGACTPIPERVLVIGQAHPNHRPGSGAAPGFASQHIPSVPSPACRSGGVQSVAPASPPLWRGLGCYKVAADGSLAGPVGNLHAENLLRPLEVAANLSPGIRRLFSATNCGLCRPRRSRTRAFLHTVQSSSSAASQPPSPRPTWNTGHRRRPRRPPTGGTWPRGCRKVVSVRASVAAGMAPGRPRRAFVASRLRTLRAMRGWAPEPVRPGRPGASGGDAAGWKDPAVAGRQADVPLLVFVDLRRAHGRSRGKLRADPARCAVRDRRPGGMRRHDRYRCGAEPSDGAHRQLGGRVRGGGRGPVCPPSVRARQRRDRDRR